MLLIHGKHPERWVRRWSRGTTITAAVSGPVSCLVGMVAGNQLSSRPWAFLLPLTGMVVGVALADLAVLSVLYNSRRWWDGQQGLCGPDGGRKESEHIDE
jgi:hypothetical protein